MLGTKGAIHRILELPEVIAGCHLLDDLPLEAKAVPRGGVIHVDLRNGESLGPSEMRRSYFTLGLEVRVDRYREVEKDLLRQIRAWKKPPRGIVDRFRAFRPLCLMIPGASRGWRNSLATLTAKLEEVVVWPVIEF